jgi:hypothetical protein
MMLMGFSTKDYDKLNSFGLRKEEIYRLVGNSIIVQKLELIFIEIMKRL